MEVLLSKMAVGQLKGLQSKIKTKVKKSLYDYAKSGRGDVDIFKGTKGRDDLFRLRVGEYRVIFTLDRAIPAMKVIQILPRGKAYKWL